MTAPTFIIIGAAKGGTTALDAYLRQHPQVYMSPLKETNYFTQDDGIKPDFRGPGDRTIRNRDIVYRWSDYTALFEGIRNERAIGEASPWYMFAPGAAERIRRRLPEIKLVAILRNPAERAFSHYMMRRRDGNEHSATLEQAIADEPRREQELWGAGYYAGMGYYGRQLQIYFDRFPRKRIRLYLYEDFVADPQGLLRDLFEFIGVDPDFTPDMSNRPNTSGIIRNPVLRLLWTRTHGIRNLMRPFLTKGLRRRVSRYFTSRSMTRESLPNETRRTLLRLYEDDIHQLENLIELDLSHWLAPLYTDAGQRE